MLVNYINPQKDYSKTTPGLFSGPIKQSIWLRLKTMLKTMSKPLLISSFVTIICECENCFDRQRIYRDEDINHCDIGNMFLQQ